MLETSWKQQKTKEEELNVLSDVMVSFDLMSLYNQCINVSVIKLF